MDFGYVWPSPNDLGQTTAASLQACYAACLARTDCECFTFEAAANACYLKKNNGFTRRSQAGLQSVIMTPGSPGVCPPPPLPPSPPPSPPSPPPPPPPSPRPPW